MHQELKAFAQDLHLPECPRWHRGALWVSDMWDNQVLRFDLDGTRQVVHHFPPSEDPGGLGWLPDGRLLVVGMESKLLYRFEPRGQVEIHADLSPYAPWQCNDMVVAVDGTAYVTQFGFDLWGRTTGPEPTALLAVRPSGEVDVVADDLAAPNGVAISQDGLALYVAESGRSRVLRFEVGPNGRLHHRRVFTELAPVDAAPLPVAPPDGICLDRSGGLWLAEPIGKRVLRIDTSGQVTHQISCDISPLAVVLGGQGRRTLFVCGSARPHKPDRPPEPMGRLDTMVVEVPGAGRP